MANHNVNFQVDGVDFWAYDGEKYEPGVDHETSGDRAFVEALGAAQAVGIVKIKAPSQTVRDILSSAVESDKESQKLNDIAWKARAEVRAEYEARIKDPEDPFTAADLAGMVAEDLDAIPEELEAAQAALEEAI
jgi:hypothetical protein